MPDRLAAPGFVSVSSRVADGTVGNTLVEAGFCKLANQIPFHAIDTVHWTAHGGHPRRCGSELDGDTLAAMLETLFAPHADGGHGARYLMTGYLRSPAQVEAVVRLLDSERAPELYVLDPVFGDEGALYVPEQAAAAVREHLLPRADVVIPNLTEALYLLGRLESFPDAQGVAQAFADLLRVTTRGPAEFVITGIPRMHADMAGETVGVAGWSRDRGLFEFEKQRIAGDYYGTGDLFAGIFCAAYLSGARDTHYSAEMASRQILSSLWHLSQRKFPSLRAAFLQSAGVGRG